jgi:hypothetical protein
MAKKKKDLTLAEQIEKAKDKVAKYSKPYNEALYELKLLLDKKNKNQQERLLEAIGSSKRSYDEIMSFILSDPDEDI